MIESTSFTFTVKKVAALSPTEGIWHCFLWEIGNHLVVELITNLICWGCLIFVNLFSQASLFTSCPIFICHDGYSIILLEWNEKLCEPENQGSFDIQKLGSYIFHKSRSSTSGSCSNGIIFHGFRWQNKIVIDKKGFLTWWYSTALLFSFPFLDTVLSASNKQRQHLMKDSIVYYVIHRLKWLSTNSLVASVAHRGNN